MKNQLVTSQNHIAALDLGSNSFHCLIVRQSTLLSPVAHIREAVRLRAGLRAHGALDPLISKKALSTLTKFRLALDDYGVEQFKVVGTQAFRLMRKDCSFIQEAEAILRAPIDILQGEEEAFAIYRGVTGWPGVEVGHQNLVFDIGGGSSECVYGEGALPLKAISMAIGGVELMLRVQAPHGLDRAFMNTLYDTAFKEMNTPLKTLQGLDWTRVLLTSGMAEILGELSLYFNQKITPEFLAFLIDTIVERGALPLKACPSLTSDRQQIIPAALSILLAFAQHLNIPEIQLSSKALRHGVLLDVRDVEALA